MSKIHIVQEGEHFSAIAQRNGFTDFHAILDHPQNAKLRQDRAFHHALHPGDKVFIPDKQTKSESGLTTQVNPFVLDTKPLFLRLRLQEVNGKILKNTPCFIGLEDPNKTEAAPTDGKGISEHEIGALVTNGELTAQPDKKPQIKYDLKIGSLRDEKTFDGQQQRLNNLGYFAGFSQDTEQFLWAAEEFLCDNDKARVTTTPIIDPDLGVVDKTGKPDKAFVAKLVKAHGV